MLHRLLFLLTLILIAILVFGHGDDGAKLMLFLGAFVTFLFGAICKAMHEDKAEGSNMTRNSVFAVLVYWLLFGGGIGFLIACGFALAHI